MRPVRLRFQDSVQVAETAERLFARLDDQVALAQHMTRRSVMMGGGRMTYAFDDLKGQAAGSVVRMEGSAFGIRLSVEEVITDQTCFTH